MKITAKHTSGPWMEIRNNAASDYFGASFQVVTEQSEPIIICRLPTGTNEEFSANARLLAAAPDLLATLQRFYVHSIRILPDDREPSEMMEQARAAIAKATGEQS